jgi:TRAP-type C4-dicarboxylate transport system permease small subunit
MKYIEYLSGFLLSIMLVTILGQILFRFFDIGISWTEELARYTMIYLTFFGSVASLAYGTHIAVTLLSDHLTPGLQAWIALVRDALVILVLVVMAFTAFDLAARPMIVNQLTPALQVSTSVLYLALPIASVAMALVAAWLLVKDVRRIAELLFGNGSDAR